MVRTVIIPGNAAASTILYNLSDFRVQYTEMIFTLTFLEETMAQAELKKLISIARDSSRSDEERTTAIHTLKRFSPEEAIPYLLELMKDDALSVRWAAATTLRHFGRDMLEPLLRALETKPADIRFYESAHHALVRFGDPAIESILAPVLDALSGPGAATAVPAAAVEALEKLEAAA